MHATLSMTNNASDYVTTSEGVRLYTTTNDGVFLDSTPAAYIPIHQHATLVMILPTHDLSPHSTNLKKRRFIHGRWAYIFRSAASLRAWIQDKTWKPSRSYGSTILTKHIFILRYSLINETTNNWTTHRPQRIDNSVEYFFLRWTTFFLRHIYYTHWLRSAITSRNGSRGRR